MVRRRTQQGVTYLWMLFLVFLLGLGLGKGLEVQSMLLQRQAEAELVQVATAYREAIRRYYLASPGPERRYPARLEDLLRDPRSAVPRRFLRQLYPDPVSGKAFLAVPAPEGGIHGVRSPSPRAPVRQVLPAGAVGLEGPVVTRYSDWGFVYAGEGAP